MNTKKPLISILMAVYEPRMDWLKEQLESLNAQTYPNLRLYVREDCSPTVPFEEVRSLVEQCITAFPYSVKRNEENMGSNRTFALLTQEAEGAYVAYCDQDDIWLPEKLTVLQEELEASNAMMVCSDMFIIDGQGKKVADSITDIRRHHVFRSGEGLTDTLWYSNFASGCAMLVPTTMAKASLPWNPFMYYDHYITLFCANQGKVVSLNRPLLQHREHGGNQSSTLQGVTDKESYYRLWVENKANEVHWLREHFPANEKLRRILEEGDCWMQARSAYARGNRKQRSVIWKYRRYAPMVSLFELCIPWLPAPAFRLLLWARRKNLI